MADPIGIRNHNPGNIRTSGINWEGAVGEEGGFVKFDGPVAGGKALIKNLMAYNTKHGLDSVEGIINRWAPPTENNTGSYVNAVATALGVDPRDPLDMRNPTVLGGLAKAIARHENGRDAFEPGFFDQVAGGVVQGSAIDPMTKAYVESAKLPEFSKAMARTQAMADHSLVDLGAAGLADERFDIRFPRVADDLTMYDEDAQRLANTRQRAGFTESLFDAMANNTFTATLIDIANRGENDPTFDPMSEDNRKQAQAMGLYGNDQLMDYINGAKNNDDYAQRLQTAQRRVDFHNRMENTEGLRYAGVVAGQLIGGMADPVGVIATMGVGASVAAVRSAAAAGRTITIAKAGAYGAAENAAFGYALESMNNQRFSWGTLIEQASAGAALGALGGMLVNPNGRLMTDPGTVVDPRAMPVLTAGARAVQSVTDGAVQRAYDRGLVGTSEVGGNTRDHSISTNLDDIQTDTLNISGRSEEARTVPLGDFPDRLGYKPQATIDHATYKALHDAGVVTELRTANDLGKVSNYHRQYGEALPDDARAVYLPQDDRVYVFRDRLTAAEARDPSGLVMHEVGVHYGLERTVGTENYNRVLQDLEKSTDPRVREAMRAVPSDTPEHLRLEEALGYLVEKHPTLRVVKQFIASMRNWLRENVRMFRDMQVSADDAIAYVRGTVDHVKREGRMSADLTFPYVWHGSPVKGIDSLDLKYSGTGEGNSGFGFGHYVTSEKGTALDYRNKEAARRGLKPDEGGLYRLKVNAEPGAMVQWDKALDNKTAEAFRKAGSDNPTGTGGEAYTALAEKLGSQRAASEALHAQGVPGIRYETGRSRGTGTPNSNYVLFSNDALSMEARYSRTGPGAREPLNTREQRVLEGLEAVGEHMTDEAKAVADRGQRWISNMPDWMRRGDTWAYSPGTVLSAAKSKVARIAGSVLFENSLGSGKRTSTVSMTYEMLQRAYRDKYLMNIQEDMVKLMSPKERAQHIMGGQQAVARISLEVAEERMRHRMAVQRGAKYESSASPEIRRIAGQMDAQIELMTRQGKEVGNEYADNVRGSGFVGFMPQVWKWDRFGEALRSDPAKWDAIKKNFRQQYVEKNVDPVINDLIAEGADPLEVAAVRERLMQQVDHQVSTRMLESTRDPNTRTNQDTGKFESMAAELLQENFQGMALTGKVVDSFRKLLAEKIKDRTRTEFDLLREVDGVRLLDYVEHDIVSTIQHTAHRFAGQNAMAKVGFKDYADFEALITLATKDGATPAEIELLAFGGRAFGFQPMIAQDHPMLAALRNFTYAATMGKLGIANIADAAAVVTVTGLKDMFKLIGYGTRKNTDLYNQLGDMFGAGLVGQDYRVHAMTADVLPNGRALTGIGAGMLKVSQKSAQLVSWINGSNFIQRILHKAFLPIMTENLVRAARGLDSGMTPRRMADAGLDGEALARIKAQLDKHESTRKEGDAFNWETWDDQQAADKLIEAMHRVTYQTFQRTLIGEAAMWRSESALGSIVGQFHNFGLTSMEKQLGRNLAINDMNTYAAMAVGMAWSSLLFYSRLRLNTAGMSDSDAQEYMEKNTSGLRVVTGVMTYFNMSGIGAEAFGLGEVVFGGNTYQAGSGPVAAVGYLGNLSKAVNSLGSFAQGDDSASSTARSVLRILPGGNSIAGTYYSNFLRDNE